MSDSSEVELYKSLARIRPLQSLFLNLDCINWRVGCNPDMEDEPWFDEEDKEKFDEPRGPMKRGHVRQGFINCAVEETLATSIWDVIVTHKHGRRLLSLKLHTTEARNFAMPRPVSRMDEITQHLSRSWLVKQGARDDERMLFRYVRQLGLEARKAREKETQHAFTFEGGAGEHGRPHAGKQVFRRIWPEKEIGSICGCPELCAHDCPGVSCGCIHNRSNT